MPKFKMLKEGTNEELLKEVGAKITHFLQDIFDDYEVAEADGIHSFSFGSINVEIRVVPWHTEDVLINVFSYVAEEVVVTQELTEELLRLNATTPFGSFGITFDNSVIYSYSLAGRNIDKNEFLAAVQTVATIADDYDEKINEIAMAHS